MTGLGVSFPRPGSLFLYQEARRFLRARSGMGQILAIEHDSRIAHVALLMEFQNYLVPYIRHLPITWAALTDSGAEPQRVLQPIGGWRQDFLSWRRAWEAKKAGVFSLPLRRVRELVEETVERPIGPQTPIDQTFTVAASAYPKKGDSGEFTIVQVIAEEIDVQAGFELEISS